MNKPRLISLSAMLAAGLLLLGIPGCTGHTGADEDVSDAQGTPDQEGEGQVTPPDAQPDPGEPDQEGPPDVTDQPDQKPEEAYIPNKDPYPDPPYGLETGAIIKNHVFLDPATGKNAKLSQLYQDEDKKLLLLNASAGWCSACKDEAIALKTVYKNYKDKGLEIWYTLFEDWEAYPATVTFWQEWAAAMKQTYPVLLDTRFELGAYFKVEATPMNMLVDLQTMKILYLTTGYDSVGLDTKIKQFLGL